MVVVVVAFVLVPALVSALLYSTTRVKKLIMNKGGEFLISRNCGAASVEGITRSFGLIK